MTFRNITTTALLALCLILLSTDKSTAQSSVTLDHVVGEWSGFDSLLMCDFPVEFHIRITNSSGEYLTGITNGFQLWSSDGATIDLSQSMWDPTVDWSQYWDGGHFVNHFPGISADTIGFGAFRILDPGYPDGASDVAFVINVTCPCTDHGKTVCLDSAFYPPNNTWLWSGGGNEIVPSWSGERCWTISNNPCKKLIPPVLSNCPASISSDHCQTIVYDFDATEPTGEPPTFHLISGPGTINQSSGVWSYTPSLADVGSPISVVVEVCDWCWGCTQCEFGLLFYNSAPEITDGCYKYVPLLGETAMVQIAADPIDCDPDVYYEIEDIEPTTSGISIDPVTGLLECIGDSIASDQIYQVAISANDGVHISDTCWVWFVKATCQIPGDMNHLGGQVDISDMVYLVTYLFSGGYPPPSFEEADVNGSGFIDIADMTYFVDYLFGGGPPPVPCP